MMKLLEGFLTTCFLYLLLMQLFFQVLIFPSESPLKNVFYGSRKIELCLPNILEKYKEKINCSSTTAGGSVKSMPLAFFYKGSGWECSSHTGKTSPGSAKSILQDPLAGWFHRFDLALNEGPPTKSWACPVSSDFPVTKLFTSQYILIGSFF